LFKTSKLQIFSTLLGNLLQHYDTALFGFLAPFIAPLFFPKQDPWTALLLTYSILPIGILAKPLGSIFFGYIGDNKGRLKALCCSLYIMAISSIALAFVPVYADIGPWAPFLLLLCRFLQSFASSGECIGGAIYLLESNPQVSANFSSSLFNASTILGIIVASGSISLLASFDLIESSWRYLYLFGSLTAICGLYIRMQWEDFCPNKKRVSVFDFWKQIWFERRILFSIAIAAGFSYSCYVVSLIMFNGIIPLISSISLAQMLEINTYLLMFDAIALPLLGFYLKGKKAKKIMFSACICAAITGIPLTLALKSSSLFVIICIRLVFVSIGIWFSTTFHAWALSLVSPNHRYSLLSFAYAVGSQCFGMPTAAISLWLFKKTNLLSSLAWYWVTLAIATALVLAKTKTKEKINVC
jgi:MFS transporter, MHS family, proline/betaine transporter